MLLEIACPAVAKWRLSFELWLLLLQMCSCDYIDVNDLWIEASRHESHDRNYPINERNYDHISGEIRYSGGAKHAPELVARPALDRDSI